MTSKAKTKSKASSPKIIKLRIRIPYDYYEQLDQCRCAADRDNLILWHRSMIHDSLEGFLERLGLTQYQSFYLEKIFDQFVKNIEESLKEIKLEAKENNISIDTSFLEKHLLLYHLCQADKLSHVDSIEKQKKVLHTHLDSILLEYPQIIGFRLLIQLEEIIQEEIATWEKERFNIVRIETEEQKHKKHRYLHYFIKRCHDSKEPFTINKELGPTFEEKNNFILEHFRKALPDVFAEELIRPKKDPGKITRNHAYESF